MAEDFGDKTEAPTPRRLQEAREQGNIARSPDLTAAVLLLGTILLLSSYGPGLMTALKTIIVELLSPRSLTDLSPAGVAQAMLRSILVAGAAMAPLLIGMVLIAILVNVAQVGLFLSGKRLQPNLAGLNPIKGFGKLFGGGPSYVKLCMSLLKLLLVTVVAYSAVHERLAQIVSAQQLTFIQGFGLGAQVVYAIGIRIGLVLLLLAILDYAYQRYHLNRELKMTKQEVKEEMRRMDGDPVIKQRRRQIAQHMAMQRLKKTVPTADVVVTNPTEFAVALQYDSAKMHAPRVVAKGQGHMAMRIRQLAIEHGIPILERKPLARALHKLVEVGQEIPEEFYSAVAEILAYVYELTGKVRQKQAV